ncbi:ketosteroid isomerase-like protein [Crossiella equi]|uniref:Ketosteroid isomerase-like protein n=1 Tax=Crossiella equi TaxID=130796 RepID=A0ABS5A5V9_9PSEU|nr:nuclear transport factor 2 family protein [Crossiella equi]MBP2471941.1 ketosteroid isomerase-like protein [Crossiella equi]
MTPEERNLAATHHWVRLYAEDPHRMIDECYAEDFHVSFPGILEVGTKDEFHRLEAEVVPATSVDRRTRISRLVATGDTVVVEAVLGYTTDGVPRESPWCALLTFRDGLIVRDHTYVDRALWPNAAEAIAAVTGG